MNRNNPAKRSLTILAVITLLATALIFSWLTQPVMASPAAQFGDTATNTAAAATATGGTSTRTVTPGGSTTPGTPGATTTAITGTAGATTGTPGPTDTSSAFLFTTSTSSASSNAFGVTTPTLLVPVTGGDTSGGGAPANAGTWLAVWMLGLLLLGYGLRAKLGRR